ncbi:hydroxyacylglutathione hydrolase family protein [Desulfobotulus sp.]|jgi:hydroxyacylglutathione hydrolase|uniref:hydroxyacylglutathione hydrolase family protein n=1 Tax=Desulfobotulus sp. TaxID=1940337 RepID=UPI002A36E002|nr:MBL fold metallo-hydrolase [Desulfobotulus sp.]MDY0164018.1 hydroxyacylglutathione hydrolase C-terminal domain-containing protein [Desulfobotulus sp.]
MKVHQFRYNGDNLAYLLEAGGEALAVDGGAVDAILHAVEKSGLRLVGITHTHDHPDHVQGSGALCARSGAPLLSHGALCAKGELSLGGERLAVLATPGHTLDSVCFVGEGFVISGDTLFNGTVGNCFSGDLDAFFHSMEKLLSLPGDTRIYAGHDYVKEAVAFARSIEPDNPHLEAYLAAWNPGHGFSTLEMELRVNPYLRYNDPVMTEILVRRGLPVDTALRRWYSLMEVY